MNEEKKKKLIDITACAGTVVIMGGLLLGILLITKPIDEKLALKRKEREDFTKSNNYSISDLIIYKDNNNEVQVLLGNIPYSKSFYDIETNGYHKVFKTEDLNGKFIGRIFTEEVNPLLFYLLEEEYKRSYTKEEIEELEKNINVRIRKLG